MTDDPAIPQVDVPPGAIPEGLRFANKKQVGPLTKMISLRLKLPKPKVHQPKPKKRTWPSRVNYY